MQGALPEAGTPSPIRRRFAWKQKRATLLLGRRLLIKAIILRAIYALLFILAFIYKIFIFLILYTLFCSIFFVIIFCNFYI